MQSAAEQFPELQTQRLQLRSLTIADSEAIFALRSNEEVNRFIGRKAAQTIADAAQFIQDRLLDSSKKQGVYWAIELKSTGKLIGTICYWNINEDENSAEIGYELLPDMQGQGLMQEAITAVIAWGFIHMNLDVITAFPLGEHDKSVSLLEKNKFTYNEVNNGHLVYKLSRQTWQANQPA
ncbi:MAG: family acetyltransferase [Mucilaginibacter sp.]|nr:family acetyltransferase [Mucilaginibacter sp.]